MGFGHHFAEGKAQAGLLDAIASEFADVEFLEYSFPMLRGNSLPLIRDLDHSSWFAVGGI
jgi:hypothetical protein